MAKPASVNQVYPSRLDPVPVIDKPVEVIPAKASPGSVVPVKPIQEPNDQQPSTKPTQEPSDQHLSIGSYKISARSGSGYRILYRIVAQEGNFEESEKALEALDATNKPSSKKVLERLFVSIDKVEQAMRMDPAWRTHCEKKLVALQKRASDGDKKAQRTLENESRVKNGEWLGDIKEMISTCNGSSSENADNRNIKKFKEAKLSFMMFPPRPRNGQSSAIAIFPIKHLDKVKKALEIVHG